MTIPQHVIFGLNNIPIQFHWPTNLVVKNIPSPFQWRYGSFWRRASNDNIVFRSINLAVNIAFSRTHITLIRTQKTSRTRAHEGTDMGEVRAMRDWRERKTDISLPGS